MFYCGIDWSKDYHNLAAAAANHLIVQGKAVLFATAPELLAMVRQGFDDP